jgi:hypothetical protein
MRYEDGSNEVKTRHNTMLREVVVLAMIGAFPITSVADGNSNRTDSSKYDRSINKFIFEA